MKEYAIRVNPEASGGRMENILGICNSPVISSRDGATRQVKWFRELGATYVRHHDAPLENPGFDLVDVSRIFPLFDADENDPANYRFAETDYYFSFFADTDVRLELRLGETIDHSGLSSRVHMPKDPAKWARVCVKILQHYTEGWANGMRIPIDRVSIWEEPGNVPALFMGKFSDYVRLFVTAYPILREAFPKLVIGGFNDNWYYGKDGIASLLDACLERGIEPGFIGLTMYSREVKAFSEACRELRTMLDERGFASTGIQFSEWHYGPLCWSGDVASRRELNGFHSAENAAFTAAVLIDLLDSPVDLAYYYAWATGNWGVMPPRVTPQRLWPVYYGMKFFTDTVRFGSRIAVEGELPENVFVLAAKNDAGKMRILIAACGTEDQVLNVHVPGCRVGTRYVIEDDGVFHPLEGIDFTISAPGDFSVRPDGVISLPILAGWRVYALEVE